MSTRYKPEHYTSVSPYLVVKRASNTIDFLKQVFDAIELRRYQSPDGRVMHAEVKIDDSVIMISDGNDGWPAVPAHIHVYVKDVDSTYVRALDAGAESVQAPIQKEDEDKRGGVKDSGGTTWWISTQVGINTTG